MPRDTTWNDQFLEAFQLPPSAPLLPLKPELPLNSPYKDNRNIDFPSNEKPARNKLGESEYLHGLSLSHKAPNERNFVLEWEIEM